MKRTVIFTLLFFMGVSGLCGAMNSKPALRAACSASTIDTESSNWQKERCDHFAKTGRNLVRSGFDLLVLPGRKSIEIRKEKGGIWTLIDTIVLPDELDGYFNLGGMITLVTKARVTRDFYFK